MFSTNERAPTAGMPVSRVSERARVFVTSGDKQPGTLAQRGQRASSKFGSLLRTGKSQSLAGAPVHGPGMRPTTEKIFELGVRGPQGSGVRDTAALSGGQPQGLDQGLPAPALPGPDELDEQVYAESCDPLVRSLSLPSLFVRGGGSVPPTMDLTPVTLPAGVVNWVERCRVSRPGRGRQISIDLGGGVFAGTNITLSYDVLTGLELELTPLTGEGHELGELLRERLEERGIAVTRLRVNCGTEAGRSPSEEL